ncbi:hypothetical protein Q5424_17190 [Conexibacter sp. JD483]|uniref:hypothetical protein n=1 Tax=unclassified Conexibacter TaxID=2627773 RepID=UPI00271995E3|nr:MULTISPECIES: hypothetical protein [unclassified Conexibacter]MDO8188662.1 hypothetical protein [Conexibacter sp. CPCC 205706]MDO8199365.1 hypothetical protein [Conexibacter sp. CPCC 205762]MDR9370835.1 hypothetical protein [Conexibacter sp. JD483]
MRSVFRLAVVTVVCGLLPLVATTQAQADATWQLEQPAAPPPPAGVAPAPFPVPLGPVGDVDFVAPNRGVLTTAGNGPVPRGLYAYDGVAWHLLATVCGGEDGRIAWSGPNEFWAVADQRAAQQSDLALRFNDRSLCRIAGGRVVASYATPQGQPGSYMPMDAATCATADDCWFAGGLLQSPPPFGAFHLHWDGQRLTSVPSVDAPAGNDPAHAVLDLVSHQGSVFESVAIRDEDPVNPDAPDGEQPSFLHLLSPDLSNPFTSLPLTVDLGRTVTNARARPADLDAFDLSSDGSTLWAIAGAAAGRANPIVLQLPAGGDFVQLRLTAGGGEVLPAGAAVTDIAAEPGTGAVWVAYRSNGGPSERAQVARIAADGTVTRSDVVPAIDDPAGPKGTADKLACPATDDCWLTTTRGWLFHLTDGSTHARDTDPAFAGVITTRPIDDGIPYQPPIDLPIDDSLARQRRASAPEEPGTGGDGGDRISRRPQRVRSLVTRVGTPRLLKGTTTLRISFTLTARARVSIVASRRKRVVARTKPVKLGKGRHALRIRLDRRRWPTGLAVKAKPLARRGAAVAVTASVSAGRASGSR